MAEVCPRCHESDRMRGAWCDRCMCWASQGPLTPREAVAAGMPWAARPAPDFEGPALAHGGAAPAVPDVARDPVGWARTQAEAPRQRAVGEASAGETATCRSCGAPIRWVRTRAGKAMPLDAQPVATGNVVLGEDGTARTLTRKQVMLGGIVGDRYTSHFATCANASQHRRRQPREAGQP